MAIFSLKVPEMNSGDMLHWGRNLLIFTKISKKEKLLAKEIGYF